MAASFHGKVSKWLCPKHPSSVSASNPQLLTPKRPFNSVFFGHASGHRHCGLQKEIQTLPSSLKWLSSEDKQDLELKQVFTVL